MPWSESVAFCVCAAVNGAVMIAVLYYFYRDQK